MTDNRKQWGIPQIALYIADLVLRFFKLDVQVEPGHSIFYAGSKALSYILLAIPIFIAFLVFRGGKKTRKRA
jgi:hypothetical protein